MEQLTDVFLQALQRDDIAAVRSFPHGKMPALKAPMTAVGIRSVQGGEQAVYTYLGMREEDGEIRPFYGRQLVAQMLLEVYCPRSIGAQACQKQAERVVDLLAEGVDGVRIEQFSMQGVAYDEVSDCFRCEVTAKTNAYVYAVANAEETEFTDFILKGEVK